MFRALKIIPAWRYALSLLLKLVVICICVVAFGLITAVPAGHAGLRESVYETTLPNGLKVILLENHRAPLVTFQIWYRVGARNENWGKTGLSHVLEHMMFKGTKRIGPEELARIIQKNGGNLNAFTSDDFTAYFENISADRLAIPIRLEADRMRNLVLREEDFATERMVVIEERRLRTEDDPRSFLLEQTNATAFQTSPYHWPIIGWIHDLDRLTLDDLKDYYRTYYSPNNAFLVVVGDFKKEDLLKTIEKSFGPVPKGKMPNQERNVDPQQNGERRVFAKREARLPAILMGYHVPNLRDPDSYVLEVIAAILSEGKSSRFYRNLVLRKQLVIEASAENSLLSYDPNLFYFSATLLPGKEAGEVEGALDEEITRIQTEPVSAEELERAKNQLEASFVYSQDSLFYQGMLLAQHEIVSSWKAIDDYIPSIRRVTPEDIQRVSRAYLTRDNRTVGILVPLAVQNSEPANPQSPPEQSR